ncbi:cytochrome-b5 reductase [Enteropsectra breve]|nr:cytochrome-b5 reductase [Enteropsectra breve]
MVFRVFKIAEIKHTTADTMHFTFVTEEELAELVVSSCVMIQAENGCVRPYTPIRTFSNGFELLIKIYKDGVMTQWLSRKKVGDTILINAYITTKPFLNNEHVNILMVAGGTGITPMYQILQHAFSCNKNISKFTLLNFNKTENDILLKEELIGFPNVDTRFILTRDQNIQDNKLSAVKEADVKDFIVKHIEKNSYDYIYVCGPAGFMEMISGNKTPDKQQGELTGLLAEIGIPKTKVHKF